MLTKKSDNDYIHFFNNDLWSVKGELNLKEITHSYDECKEIQDFLLWLLTIAIILFMATASYFMSFWISEEVSKAHQKIRSNLVK